MIAGLFFGLAPALQTRWSDLRASLTEGSRTSTSGLLLRRFQSFLVIFEVAVTFMLLAGAGVLLKSFYLLNQVPLGFQPEHLLTARVDLAPLKYSTPQLRNNFQEELLGRIRSFPGVQNVTLLLAAAALTRTVGIPVLVLAGLYLLVRRVGWARLGAFAEPLPAGRQRGDAADRGQDAKRALARVGLKPRVQ